MKPLSSEEIYEFYEAISSSRGYEEHILLAQDLVEALESIPMLREEIAAAQKALAAAEAVLSDPENIRFVRSRMSTDA